MEPNEGIEYEGAVLQELRGIREAITKANGQLDMLAVIDQKLLKRQGRFRLNLFALLGLHKLDIKGRIIFSVVVFLVATGHMDTARDLLIRFGIGG